MTTTGTQAADIDLLIAYARSRDAEAFAELARRYAGLVYGTALRITGSDADAQDVCQDCFLRLAREAGRVAPPLPAWLHLAARSRAIDCTRRTAARRRHEQRTSRRNSSELSQWETLQPHIDAAIAALPAELRELVTQHYLCGVAQSELAGLTGVSQATVSRRLAEAVELLRERLTRHGVAMPASVLAGELLRQGSGPVPDVLLAALGRMAVGGVPPARLGTAVKVGIAAALAVVGVAICLQIALRASDGASTMTARQTVPPVRYVVSGVRRMNGAGSPVPEEVQPLSALRSVVQALGSGHGLTQLSGGADRAHNVYINLMGISGAAFRIAWDTPLNDGTSDLLYVSDDPFEALRRAAAACGYRCGVYVRPDALKQLGQAKALSEADARNLIVVSIRDRKRPLLARGVLGPCMSVITGIEPEQDAVLGLSYFQNFEDQRKNATLEPSGYFRKTHWFADTQAIIVLEDGPAPAPLQQQRRSSLAWILQVMRNTKVRELPTGQAAYAAWVRFLEDADRFPADAEAAREAYFAHRMTGLMLAEGRAYAAEYLRAIAADEPGAATELREAADRCKGVHAAVMQMWSHTGNGGFSNEDMRPFNDPAIRRQIADEVRICASLDEQIAGEIAKAVDALGVP